MTNIPGTSLPDNAVHRASLWLERLKYDLRPEDVMEGELERVEDRVWEELISETGLDLTSDQLKEAAVFYGASLRQLMFGPGGADVTVIRPDGATYGLLEMFISAWFDGFMHGAATLAGKRGLSNEETRDG